MKQVESLDGGQAFPTEGGDHSGCYAHTGMTLREYFAGQAIVGLLAAKSGEEVMTSTIDLAFTIADAMIARARQDRDTALGIVEDEDEDES